MSSKQIPGQPLIAPLPVERLEVKVKVNGIEQTLTKAAETSIRNAVEMIRRRGDAQKAGWESFKGIGKHLEITEGGILDVTKEGSKNILETQVSQTKIDILNKIATTTDAVAAYLKESSKNVSIHVQIVPSSPIVNHFARSIAIEEHHHQAILAVEKLLNDPLKGTAVLQSRGFSLEQIASMKASIGALGTASARVGAIMDSVYQSVKEGKIQEASNRYAIEMPEAFSTYCHAMGVWQKEQQSLNRQLGEKHPFQLNMDHPQFQVVVAREFSKAIPAATNEMRTTIENLHANYMSATPVKLQTKIHDKAKALYEKEKQLNDSLQKALKEVGTPKFEAKMLQEGLSTEEVLGYISNYRQNISKLKQASNHVLERLEITIYYLSNGSLQGAMDFFTVFMKEHYADYVKACDLLIRGQRYGQGRTLGEKWESFELPLNTPTFYVTFLEDVSRIASEAAKTDYPQELNSEAWNETLIMSKQHAINLKGDLKNTIAVDVFDVQRKNKAYLKNFEMFVIYYKNNREQFETLMQQHGIPSWKSAFIMNPFEVALSAIKDWTQKYQSVVDFASMGLNEEALEEYAELISTDFPKLAETCNQANLAKQDLAADSIRNALIEFYMPMARESTIIRNEIDWEQISNQAASEGLSKEEAHEKAIRSKLDSMMTNTLSVDRQPLKVELTFNQMIQNAILENIVQGDLKVDMNEDGVEKRTATINDEKLKENEEIYNALILVRNHLNRMNSELLPNFERLFKQDERFLQISDASNMKKFPKLQEAWNRTLIKQGWSQKGFKVFSGLYNRYASAIEPLKKAEQAIKAESNPQKKRALKAQFQVLARQQMPVVKELHTEMRKAGGFKKLQTLQQAVAEFRELAWATVDLEILTRLQSNFEPKKFKVDYDTMPIEDKKIIQQVLPELVALDKAAEVDSLLKLMKDRVTFLNDIYIQFRPYSGWEFGKVNKQLSQGLSADDKASFEKVLKAQQWNLESVEKLNTWFDAYMREVLPIQKAKEEFSADTESVQLQAKLKKTYKEHITKLFELETEFSNTFGKIDTLKNLEQAVVNYTNVLKNKLVTAEALYSKHSHESWYKDEIEQLKNKLSPLEQFKIDEVIKNTQRAVIEAEDILFPFKGRDGEPHLSWDKEFLAALTDKSSPLLMIKEKDGRSTWNTILAKHGLRGRGDTILKSKVDSIVELHQKYQRELKKLADLERQLEAHPEDPKLLQLLIKEMTLRRTRIDQLEIDYKAKSKDIDKLEKALQEFSTYVESALQQTLILTQRSAGKKGKVSSEKIRTLQKLLNKVDIEKAFGEKRNFWTQLKDRFGKF